MNTEIVYLLAELREQGYTELNLLTRAYAEIPDPFSALAAYQQSIVVWRNQFSFSV